MSFLREERGSPAPADATVELPSVLGGGGGTRPEEMAYLAVVTRLLQPRTIFEIGTFTGLTTCAFAINAPPDARVITLDLPPDFSTQQLGTSEFIDSDKGLVEERSLGLYLRRFGLEGRCTQLLCDSMAFDPAPYLGVVELGFIDGAHALPFVVNDTEKMAAMLTDRGLVFWHDYGGMGEFGPLTAYLEGLSKRAPLYRVPFTSLAWTTGRDLKAALLPARERQRAAPLRASETRRV
ncbi:MAG TPA: class I SAM-dependent methyltransferase [Thermoanaerobaculia bacterium]|nr:class I SAM-dependent methyltransferase [Thermoanaerobaculia bacterium]